MRLNLRLSGTAEKLIIDLSEKLEVPPKEIIIDSLALYQIAVKEIQRSGQLGIRRNGEFIAISTGTLLALEQETSPQAVDSSFHME